MRHLTVRAFRETPLQQKGSASLIQCRLISFNLRIKAISLISAIIIQILILANAAFSQQGTNKSEALRDSLIFTAIEQSIIHNYAAAESAAVELIRLFPASPEGYFYRAGVLNSMIIDYEENYREDDFYHNIDSTVTQAEARIKINPNDPWAHFYLGGAKAYLALHHIRNEHYFSALGNGLKALSELKLCLESDSTIYDAYLGLGNYEYWISRRTEFLQWFPFIPDHRAEGISMIYTAMMKGKYSYTCAASALAWVLIDAERYEEALEAIQTPLEDYPDSRFFLFSKSRCLFEMGRYQESIESYTKLLGSIRSADINNHFNELGILVKLAEANIALGHYEKAVKYCEEGLALKLCAEVEKRSGKSLKKLKGMLDDCSNRTDSTRK